MHICLQFDDEDIHLESNNRADFVVQIFLDSRPQDESLKGLVVILAFLVRKLRQNKQKLITVGKSTEITQHIFQ